MAVGTAASRSSSSDAVEYKYIYSRMNKNIEKLYMKYMRQLVYNSL